MSMAMYLHKVFILLATLAVGVFLRKTNVVRAEAFHPLSMLVSHFTLPCAILSGCRDLTLRGNCLLFIGAGIAVNLLLLLVGWLAGKNKGTEGKMFCMINSAALNVGNFAAPLLTGSAMTSALPSVFFFDIGNALMGCGGNYTLSCAALEKRQGRSSGRDILRQLSRSTCFDLYVVLIVLAVMRIQLPEGLYTYADNVAASNSVLVMLLFGIGFNWNISRRELQTALMVFVLRYVTLIVLSFLVLLLPMSDDILLGIAIATISPISTMCVLFTEESGGDCMLSSTMASFSILVSMAVLLFCMPLWQMLLVWK